MARIRFSSDKTKLTGLTDGYGACKTGPLKAGTYHLTLEIKEDRQLTCAVTIYPANGKKGYMLLFEGNALLFSNGIRFVIPEDCIAVDFGVQEPGER